MPERRFRCTYLIATAEASRTWRDTTASVTDTDRPSIPLRQSMEGRDDLHRMLRTRARGFGPEVKRRIMLGTYMLSAGYYDAYYLKAQQVRTLIKGDYDRAFDRVDVVAMPTSPTPHSRSASEHPIRCRCTGRRLHGEREPGRPARGQRSLRVHVRSAADRIAADRARVR